MFSIQGQKLGEAEGLSDQSDGCVALVDFEDAEDVGRGRGVAHHVQPEGGAGDGLQLRAAVQPQEARYLARLQEVEVVRAGRRRGAVSLDALQLLRPLAPRHHVQLDVLGLLLVEEHLRRAEEESCHGAGADWRSWLRFWLVSAARES